MLLSADLLASMMASAATRSLSTGAVVFSSSSSSMVIPVQGIAGAHATEQLLAGQVRRIFFIFLTDELN